MEWLAELLKKTAWTMRTPEPYGAFHLCFFVFGAAAAVFAAYLLRSSGEKTVRGLVLTSGVLLAAAEVYKQLFYTFALNGGNYYWWILPFQLCSMPMYFCIIAPLLTRGRARDTLYDFLLAFGTMGGVAAFLQPEGLLHPYITLTLHSFLWHLIMIFTGCLLGFSGMAGRKMSGLGRAILLYIALCGAAYCINTACWNASNGQINMFYIGPMTTTTVVFKDIAAVCGQGAATAAYMAASCFGAFLFYTPFCVRNNKQN